MNANLRRVLVASNAVMAVLFAAFLAYTWFARGHLERLARAYVTDKTAQYAKPAVDIAEQAIESKTVKVLLGDANVDRVRREIDNYRRDPKAYIATLAGNRLRDAGADVDHRLAAKALVWKEKVAAYYDDTLDALIDDVRIFAGTNFAASLLALALAAFGRRDRMDRLAWFSLAMLLAVASCAYMYVDSMTFFRILTRSHIGWWYPAVLAATAIGAYWDFRPKTAIVPRR